MNKVAKYAFGWYSISVSTDEEDMSEFNCSMQTGLTIQTGLTSF